MISGNAMQHLSESGWVCDITPPTIIRGTNVKISTISIPAIVIPLDTGAGRTLDHGRPAGQEIQTIANRRSPKESRTIMIWFLQSEDRDTNSRSASASVCCFPSASAVVAVVAWRGWTRSPTTSLPTSLRSGPSAFRTRPPPVPHRRIPASSPSSPADTAGAEETGAAGSGRRPQGPDEYQTSDPAGGPAQLRCRGGGLEGLRRHDRRFPALSRAKTPRTRGHC